MAQELYDAIVIGGGAAGLSAALMLGRACRSVLVCDDGRPRNAVAERMHGFLTRDGMPPGDLLRSAREELQRYPSVAFESMHVAHARREGDRFEIRDGDGAAHYARRVLLVTGVYDALPEIAGLRERWGKSVFVCPYCDGWEVRNRRLAIVGKGRRAVELAQELYQWSSDLLVCLQEADDLTDAHRRWLTAVGADVRAEAVAALQGPERSVEAVAFSSGPTERCDAAFLCAPLRQRYPLVDMLGCRVRGDGEIDTDERGRTGVDGVYAAGDAVTTIHQVVLAASSGVRAAMALNEDQVADEVRAAIER